MESRALVFRVIQSIMVRDRKMPVNKVVRIPIISVTAKPLRPHTGKTPIPQY